MAARAITAGRRSRPRPAVSCRVAGGLQRVDPHLLAHASTGPSSRPSLIRMTWTPVTASPAMIARWIGAAPRQRGSSEACRLKQPRRGASSTSRRQDLAERPPPRRRRGPAPANAAISAGSRIETGVRTAGPWLSAKACTGEGLQVLAPAARGGRLGIDAGDLVAGGDELGCRQATEKSGVPRKARRMADVLDGPAPLGRQGRDMSRNRRPWTAVLWATPFPGGNAMRSITPSPSPAWPPSSLAACSDEHATQIKEGAKAAGKRDQAGRHRHQERPRRQGSRHGAEGKHRGSRRRRQGRGRRGRRQGQGSRPRHGHGNQGSGGRHQRRRQEGRLERQEGSPRGDAVGSRNHRGQALTAGRRPSRPRSRGECLSPTVGLEPWPRGAPS